MQIPPLSAAGPGTAVRAGGKMRRLRRVLQLAFVAAAFAGLGWALSNQWPRVQDSLKRLDPAIVAVVLALGLAVLACSFVSWRAVLSGLGPVVPLLPAGRIFFVGQLGKYLPGSVWPLVAQMELGRAAGISRTRVVVASLLAIATSILVGAAMGLGCLPFLDVPLALRLLGPFLAVVALAMLHPTALNSVVGFGLRLARRPALPTPLPGRAIVISAAACALSWLLGGVGTWVLATRFGAHGLWVLPLCVAAYAFALTIGLLVVPAPAGAGVREGVFVLFLSLSLAAGPATAVALVLRLVLAVSDGLVAAAALVASGNWLGTRLSSRRNNQSRTPAPTVLAPARRHRSMAIAEHQRRPEGITSAEPNRVLD
ncbi:MAG: lysylphosphatidylglycerol synthase domain-containing protein [Frankiaceae bacterium]